MIPGLPQLLAVDYNAPPRKYRWQYHCHRDRHLDLAKAVCDQMHVRSTGVADPQLSFCRIALATRLLRGLKCYHIIAAGADASKLVNNAPTQRPTKQQAAKARKRDADLGEAGAVTSMPATITQIEASAFYSQLDTLVRFASTCPCAHAQLTLECMCTSNNDCVCCRHRWSRLLWPITCWVLSTS